MSFQYNENNSNSLCSTCSQRLTNSYALQMDIESNTNFENYDNSCDENYKRDPLMVDKLSNTSPHKFYVDKIYCSHCKVHFARNDLAIHLLDCKMKKEADELNLPSARHLYMCCLCKFLVYKHDSQTHIESCEGIIN